MTTIIHARTRSQARRNTEVLKAKGVRGVKTIDGVDETGLRWHTQIVREQLSAPVSSKGDTLSTYEQDKCVQATTARNSGQYSRKSVVVLYKPTYRRRMLGVTK